MSNIRAPNGGEWSKEAADTIQTYSTGRILQAQIAGYTQDDLPEVYLFASITKDVSQPSRHEFGRYLIFLFAITECTVH